MLGNNKLMPISVIILAISIVFASIYIGVSLKEVANKSTHIDSQVIDILELDEAAKYLRLSEGDLLYLIIENDQDINYIEINGKYIFSKQALHEWVRSTQLKVER